MARAVDLHDVADLAVSAGEIVDALHCNIQALCPGVDVEHVGATSLGRGLTKGDVDIAVRVLTAEAFERVVASLRKQFEIAQRRNWTPTYASFSDRRWALPVGLQVCVIGSPDDFLVALRDLFRREPGLAEAYDKVKRKAAARGPDAYWRAKDRFLRRLINERSLDPDRPRTDEAALQLALSGGSVSLAANAVTVTGRSDRDVETERAEPLLKRYWLPKHLDDAVLAAPNTPAADALLRIVPDRMRVIDEEDPSSWTERSIDKAAEAVEACLGNVAQPKGEEDDIKASWWLPLEDVCHHVLDWYRRARHPGPIEGQGLLRSVHHRQSIRVPHK